MKKTIVEKIFSQKIGREVHAGELIEIEPDRVMSHDNAALVIQQFNGLFPPPRRAQLEPQQIL